MKNNVLIAVICLGFTVLSGAMVLAQETAPAKTDNTKPAAEEKSASNKMSASEMVRQRRASMIGYRGRDPFWPVGHQGKKAPPVKPVDRGDEENTGVAASDEEWLAAERSLRVSAVVADYAIVSGRVVAPGDTINLKIGRFIFAWTVRSISKESGLKLDRTRARPVGK